MKRILTRIFAWLALGVPLLIIAALIALQVFLGTNTAGRIIRERINAMIPGRVIWEAQSVSVFRGQVRLSGLRLLEPEGRTVIAIDSFSADISLTDLLFDRIFIQSAAIQKPGVFLSLNRQGRLNLSEALGLSETEVSRQPAPAPETGQMPRIRIRRLNLESGHFTFHTAGTAQSQSRIELRDIGIALANAHLRQRSVQIDLSIASGQFNSPGLSAPIQGLQFEAALRQGRIAPLRMELRSAGSHLRISGGVANIFHDPRMDDVDISLTAELSDLRQMLGLETGLAGKLQAKAAAAGKPSDPEISLDLDYSGGRLAGLDIPELQISARMQDRKVDLKRLDAMLAGGRIESAGTIDLQSAFAGGFMSAPANLQAVAYQLRIRTRDIQIAELPGTAGVKGKISGPAALEGSGISLGPLAAKLTADLQAKDLVPVNNMAPLDLNGKIRGGLAAKKLTLDRVRLEAPDFKINTAGSYDISENRLDLDISAAAPRVERIARRLGVSAVSGGAAELRARVSGPAARPEVTASVHLRHPKFGKAAVEKIDADLFFADGLLGLEPLKIATGNSISMLSGSIRLLDPQTGKPLADPGLDLTLRQSTIFLQDFFPAASGRIRISGNIGGSVQHPEGMLTANGEDIVTAVQSIPAASLKARLKDRRVHLEPLEIMLEPDQSVETRGWVSMDQQYSLRIESDPIALENLKALANTSLDGQVRITAKGEGHIQDPSLQARIWMEKLRTDGQSFPNVALDAELQGMEIRAQIQTPVSARLTYSIANGNFSASTELADTDLAPFFEVIGYPEASGSITGTLKADGNVFRPENIRARLSAADLRILYGGREIAATRDFSASMENGEIGIPGSRITLLEEGFLEIRGTGNLQKEIDIRADGVFPAGLARDLVPAIASPRGQISLSARVRGSFGQPDISAELGLSDLGCLFPQTDQQLHAVNGKIRMENQRVTISGLSGRVDDGVFTLNGEIGLADFRPTHTDLQITAANLPIRVPDTLDMELNADLQLAGTSAEAQLAGDIVILEGVYYKDAKLSLIQMAGEIGQRRRQEPLSSRQPAIEIPFLEKLGLDVAVGHRRPFVVDNNLALLDIRPQLRLGGTAADPRLTGRAEITEGTVSYRKTEFTVEKGIIDFVNPYRIEPTVDIEAESRVREWTITLIITGTPDNLDFQLSSSPPETDPDILSLLAVGKTTRELGQSSGGPSPEAMLAGLVAGRLEKQVKAGTGLDIVELEYQKNGTGAEEAGDVRLTVGKELSRRLTVKYGVAHKGGEMIRQSTGIYKLMEDLSVNAFQDSAGAFGGEMRYRLEFR